MRGVYDSAGLRRARISRAALWPSGFSDAFGSRIEDFGAQYPACICTCRCFKCGLAVPSHDSDSRWIATPFLTTLSFVTPCRFLSRGRPEINAAPAISIFAFYIHDEVLGAVVISVASFFPFHATYWLNGHSFMERELNRKQIGFRKNDNAFLATYDVARRGSDCALGERRSRGGTTGGLQRPGCCAAYGRIPRRATALRLR
jgi:hypothetical protein